MLGEPQSMMIKKSDEQGDVRTVVFVQPPFSNALSQNRKYYIRNNLHHFYIIKNVFIIIGLLLTLME